MKARAKRKTNVAIEHAYACDPQNGRGHVLDDNLKYCVIH